MSEYTLTSSAYLKPLLHALKHPSHAVVGLLLAREQKIVDAIPVLHFWSDLSGTLEMALQQVDIYAAENDMQIAGLYVANPALSDRTLPTSAVRVLDRIRQNNQNAIGFVIDNEKLSSDENALIPYLYKDGQFRHVPFDSAFHIDKLPSLTQARRDHRHKRIVDFDEHLEDVSLDWLKNGEVLN
ncbi:uncharacterized protein VTP21DRAFT_696 [Calcarisporiella thermophila]|uniref:uncharacterized protein n=1 Tax=Calcarisporiella thermophila TaxID=911321 RepID=UPI0037420873